MTSSLDTRITVLENKLKALEENVSSRGVYVDGLIDYTKKNKLTHPIVSEIKLAVKEAREKK